MEWQKKTTHDFSQREIDRMCVMNYHVIHITNFGKLNEIENNAVRNSANSWQEMNAFSRLLEVTQTIQKFSDLGGTTQRNV